MPITQGADSTVEATWKLIWKKCTDGAGTNHPGLIERLVTMGDYTRPA